MCLLPLIALAVIAQAASVIANNPKRGLAYPNERDHLQDIARAYGTSVSWTYNWDVNSMVSIPSSSGITHVPMQWGVQGAEGFFAQVVGGGYQTVLVRSLTAFQSARSIDKSKRHSTNQISQVNSMSPPIRQ